MSLQLLALTEGHLNMPTGHPIYFIKYNINSLPLLTMDCKVYLYPNNWEIVTLKTYYATHAISPVCFAKSPVFCSSQFGSNETYWVVQESKHSKILLSSIWIEGTLTKRYLFWLRNISRL